MTNSTQMCPTNYPVPSQAEALFCTHLRQVLDLPKDALEIGHVLFKKLNPTHPLVLASTSALATALYSLNMSLHSATMAASFVFNSVFSRINTFTFFELNADKIGAENPLFRAIGKIMEYTSLTMSFKIVKKSFLTLAQLPSLVAKVSPLALKVGLAYGGANLAYTALCANYESFIGATPGSYQSLLSNVKASLQSNPDTFPQMIAAATVAQIKNSFMQSMEKNDQELRQQALTNAQGAHSRLQELHQEKKITPQEFLSLREGFALTFSPLLWSRCEMDSITNKPISSSVVQHFSKAGLAATKVLDILNDETEARKPSSRLLMGSALQLQVYLKALNKKYNQDWLSEYINAAS